MKDSATPPGYPDKQITASGTVYNATTARAIQHNSAIDVSCLHTSKKRLYNCTKQQVKKGTNGRFRPAHQGPAKNLKRKYKPVPARREVDRELRNPKAVPRDG
ncbi:MAG: hypothetical protein PF436_01955 [Prolixibacteraceae bacterium]|nr:hypothetical protein [Prolixibacteraceae bacterium]